MADGIIKRGERWVARPYDPLSGQARWLGTFASRKEARLAIAAFRLQRKAPERMAFSVFAADWLAKMAGRVRPRTLADYTSSVAQLKSLLGDPPIGSITPRMVEEMVATSTARYAGNTTRKQVTRLRQMLDAAVRWGWLPSNPALARVALPKPRRREVTPLTPQEAQRLVDASEPYYRPILVTALHTGLRAGELFGLTWDDYDGAAITVRHSLWGRTLTEPKTAAAHRTIVLTPANIAAIDAHRNECPETTEGFIFPAPHGGPLVARTWSDVMRRTAKAAKLPDVRLHDLRHCYASLLIRGGASPKLVQSLLGHSTITVTMDTYGHLFPDEKGQAAAMVASYFGSISVAEEAKKAE
jgi:integrase